MKIRCRIRVGTYDKQMRLHARACGQVCTHLVDGIPICDKHAQRLAGDNVIYSVHPDGAKLPRAKPQKVAA